jgi:hypothetical protein
MSIGRIPKRNIGGWAREIIDSCSASLVDRIQRGAVYRSMFLVGDENGAPQTYNKTQSHVEKMSANIYLPNTLRFSITPPEDVGPDERAKAKRAANELNLNIASSDTDLCLEEAFDWALIKGKTFVKMGWDARKKELQSWLLQPEYMGVLREDVGTLDKQEAFFQSTYMIPEEFRRRIAGLPDEKELWRKVQAYITPSKDGEGPDRDTMLKQVILGGTNPYQAAGQNSGQTARGLVNWLAGPAPTWSPKTLAGIIRFDELWVWDTDREDWVTIQLVGNDCVVEGKTVQRNIFSTDPQNPLSYADDDNPLKGIHPFLEICPNPLHGYFWGLSAIPVIALAQKTLNARVDGINKLLRKQEDPPMYARGGGSINEIALSRLRKPGGWMTDPNPNAEVKVMAPEIPAGLYESMHEAEAIFEEVAGETAVTQGKGESGVRAQGHAETLVRMASPRLKRKALRGERQVAKVGGLAFLILQAKSDRKFKVWLPESEAGIQASLEPSDPLAQAPAPKMKAIEFRLKDVDEDAKVGVDSHSSSPVFAADARELVEWMVSKGIISAERAIELLHPPMEDELVADAERKRVEEAELIRQHPELLTQGKKKK